MVDTARTAPLLARPAALVDRAALWVTRRTRRTARVDQMTVAQRLSRLDHLAVLTENTAPADFFGPPRRIRPDIEGDRLSWPSLHEPVFPEVTERYQAFHLNNRAHALTVPAGPRRPVVIAVHGYGGGVLRVESRVFPTRRWARRGLGVVLYSMPFHGPRRAPGDRLRFPSARPLVTIEAFRHAIRELRELVGWLLDGGAPAVGVVGMSLGGYTAALLATVEPRLAFALATIPLASLADYAHTHGRLRGDSAAQAAQRDGLERVYAPVSPLHRPLAIDPAKVVVAGGLADRITPVDHAERIARHFGCELVTMEGGHLLQVGRRRAWQALERRVPAA